MKLKIVSLMEKMDISQKTELEQKEKDSKCAQISSSCVLDMKSEKEKKKNCLRFRSFMLITKNQMQISPITTSANAKTVPYFMKILSLSVSLSNYCQDHQNIAFDISRPVC